MVKKRDGLEFRTKKEWGGMRKGDWSKGVVADVFLPVTDVFGPAHDPVKLVLRK
jgi:hypothetical protein